MANTIETRGDTTVLADIIARDITEITDDVVKCIAAGTFMSCSLLQTVDFYNAISVSASAFQGCTALKSISFPSLRDIYGMAFRGCTQLENVNLPLLSYVNGSSVFLGCTNLQTFSAPVLKGVGSYMFASCSALKTISLPLASNIYPSAFYNCIELSKIYLFASSVCRLSHSSVFINTPMVNSSYLGYFGSIYVPSSLVDAYKSATNWTYYADRITAYTGE